MKRFLPFLIIAIAVLVVVLGSFAFFRSKSTDTTDPFVSPKPAATTTAETSATPAAQTTPAVATTPRTDIPASVSVSVEEFGDYQCPPCGVLHPELKKLESDYGRRMIFSFHNFPLTKIHKNALVAAQAAEAARLQGRFERMHDRLYETQADWKDQDDPRPTFENYAREVGLDLKRFTRDMDGPEVQSRLDADKRDADAHGVTGTPTLFIEGQQLKYELTNYDGIAKAINYMLGLKAAARRQ